MATWQLHRTLFCLFFLYLSLIQVNSYHNNSGEVLVVLLYPVTACEQLITEYPFASAFPVAVETINNSSLGFNFTLEIGWNDTKCSELIGIKAMSERWSNRTVNAFIGPGNQSFCATSARIAASWNIPMISYVSKWFVLCQGRLSVNQDKLC